MRNKWRLRIPGYYLKVEIYKHGYSAQWFYLDDVEQSVFYACNTFMEVVDKAFANVPTEKPDPDRISEEMKEARRKYEEAVELLSSCIM